MVEWKGDVVIALFSKAVQPFRKKLHLTYMKELKTAMLMIPEDSNPK
jgi:hypothetical protein